MARLRLRAKGRKGGAVSVFKFFLMTRPGRAAVTSDELATTLRASLPVWERTHADQPAAKDTGTARLVAGWCRGCGVPIPEWVSLGVAAGEARDQAQREARCPA